VNQKFIRSQNPGTNNLHNLNGRHLGCFKPRTRQESFKVAKAWKRGGKRWRRDCDSGVALDILSSFVFSVFGLIVVSPSHMAGAMHVFEESRWSGSTVVDILFV
jgi:hypothetical protein